ncbi:MAG: NAD(P)H-dependent oxidoreductase subunit E [Myxococcota bacterium]
MVISTDARARIDAEIAKYPQPRGALLPALHIVQGEHGCIDSEAARAVAAVFEITPVEVLEVVSFYNLFHTRPQPKHQVFVCTNLPCSLRGARTLLRELGEHLGVDADGNTPDGRIRLGHEECLGACGYAPMLRIGERYHEDLDLDAAKQLLDGLD